jgi:hypothetical protein
VWLDYWGLIFGGEKDLFVFATVSTPAQAYPSSYSVGSGCSFPRRKQPGHEADHSSSCIAKVKNVWLYTFTPPFVFMVWYLVKHGNNFTFTLTVHL